MNFTLLALLWTSVSSFSFFNPPATSLPSQFLANQKSLSSTTATSSPTSLSATAHKFAKYHGIGNDFVLVDARDSREPTMPPKFGGGLCDRNYGIGADGVIFALKSPSEEYDFEMRMYNSDGSEPEMCGNGIRCLARFLAEIDGPGAERYRILTGAGLIVPVLNPDGSVTVDMGEPVLKTADVPSTLAPNADGESIVEADILDDDGKNWKINAISMGNPHGIIFVDDLEALDLERYGPQFESHSTFPAKANIEFVQVMAPDYLKMKVWERGAGPTMACGTGACALTVAAVRAGKIPRAGKEGTRVTLPGGDLYIEWRESDNHVYMTGPAEKVYEGTVIEP